MSKIKVGFIGVGRIADLHYLGYVDNPSAELYAICARSKETIDKRRQEWKFSKAYNDYHDLLADPEIDAVEILTAQNTHMEIAIAALRAGKHVSLQKPITPTLAEAEAILAETKKHPNLIFRVFDNFLTYPPIVYAKKLIEDGAIGETENIRMKMMAWNDKAGWEVPSASWEWRNAENKALRPRQTWDHGQHLWSTAWYLMGDFAKVKSWIDYTEDGNIDSPAAIMWRHLGKRKMGMCEYTYSDELHFPTKYYACDEWIEITGSKGLIKINGCSGGDVMGQPSISLFTSKGWQHFDNFNNDWATSFTEGTKDFINMLQGHKSVFLKLEDAIKILNFSFAIQESNVTNHEVVITKTAQLDLNKVI